LRIVRALLVDRTTKKETRWALNLLGLIEHARTATTKLARRKATTTIAVFTKEGKRSAVCAGAV
jgi:hypothetical protein